MAKAKTAGQIAGNFIDDFLGSFKGGFRSSEAIKTPGIDNFLGGPQYISQALKSNNWGGDTVKEVFQKNGEWNTGKIAGSAFTVASVGRIASGGGVYKDGQGNTNLVGVPFV